MGPRIEVTRARHHPIDRDHLRHANHQTITQLLDELSEIPLDAWQREIVDSPPGDDRFVATATERVGRVRDRAHAFRAEKCGPDGCLTELVRGLDLYDPVSRGRTLSHWEWWR